MLAKNKINIEAKITLDFNIERDCIVCSSPRECQLVLGTTAISGNYSFYGIEKKGKKFHIKISTIEERITVLEQRKFEIEQNLLIMKQVVGSGKGKTA